MLLTLTVTLVQKNSTKELKRFWDSRELVLNAKDFYSNFVLFLSANDHEQNGFFKCQA